MKNRRETRKRNLPTVPILPKWSFDGVLFGWQFTRTAPVAPVTAERALPSVPIWRPPGPRGPHLEARG